MNNEALALTYTEQMRLEFQEKRIESAKSAFIAVADALMEIRDQRLYRATHATFEAYCKERWDFARNYANKLIGSAEVIHSLPTELGTMVPNERVAREVAKVEPANRERVVRQAVENADGGKITARDVKEAAQDAKVIELVPKAQGLSPEAQRAGDEADRDSEKLWRLKSLWKKTNKRDRALFRGWIGGAA